MDFEEENALSCSAFLALAGSLLCGNVLTVATAPGGNMREHYAAVEQIRRNYIQVEIRGTCSSACTTLLTLPEDRVCAADGAWLGFHEVRSGGPDYDGPRNELSTAYLWARYPEKIRSRLRPLDGEIQWLRGRSSGMRRCK